MITLSIYMFAMNRLHGVQSWVRSRNEAGQTAAEYAGVVVLAGFILAAVFGLGLDEKIRTAVETAIAKILHT